jgi:uncharacterized membrane protein (UPF0127 family)
MRNLSLLFIFLFFTLDVAANEIIFPKDKLVIKTATKEIKFNIELAATTPALKQGLMFRKEMPEKSAMLFLFGQEESIINMWMKNTYIALDMLFIDKNGVIINIAKNAEPKSLAIISSIKPAKATLELNAGIADKYGITIGDKILYDAFTH